MTIKKLTILHSNDMHGDFLAEKLDGELVGGVSMLSDYIARVRSEEQNVIYAIAGDMFRGSVIDSEYKGVSTIAISNMLAPDVACVGNHEIDYGFPHMLFLEKCASFPVINANLYAKNTGRRLFSPCVLIKKDGIKILFIGIITQSILAEAKKDQRIAPLVDVSGAAEEVRRVCSAYKSADVDLTVLLTHIGFEADKKLAADLDSSCGVDVIIGGHSHTVIEKPAVVNNILIVQAGTGTNYIGRFDINIDTERNTVDSYRWRLDPIDSAHCGRDLKIERLILEYKANTDRKYGQIITRFGRKLTHPRRNEETELGDLFSDIMADSLGVDIMLLGSGSIRTDNMGPLVTFGDLTSGFSFRESVHMFRLTGEELRRVFTFLMRDEMFLGTTEFYQIPRSLRLVWNRGRKNLDTLSFRGRELEADQTFTVAMQKYHFLNLDRFLGITKDEAFALQSPRVIAASDFDIVHEYLASHQNLDSHADGRITVKQ